MRAEREENGEERDFFVGEDYCAQLPCDSIVGVGDGLRGRGRVVVVRETSGGSDSSGLKPFEETTWSYLGLLCSISRLRMRVHASLAYLKAKKKNGLSIELDFASHVERDAKVFVLKFTSHQILMFLLIFTELLKYSVSFSLKLSKFAKNSTS